MALHRPRVVIFNGPPRSGKDTAASAVWRAFENTAWLRMSAPIKRAIQAMFNFSAEEMAQLEATKGATRDADAATPMLLDRKWPGTQISFSEGWAKPYFGEYVFGHLFVRQLKQTAAPLVVCSDGGFATEWSPVIKYVGQDNVLLIKLHREGTSFAGDSRGYITLGGIRTLSLTNSGEQRSFEEATVELVRQWLCLLDN